MEHLPDLSVGLVVVVVGAFNAWQNTNIKLAISNLRNELTAKVNKNEVDIAVLQSNEKNDRDRMRIIRRAQQ